MLNMNTEETLQPIEQPDKKRILNIDIAEAIIMFCARYRMAHHILETEVLTEVQIDHLLSGIRDVIYKHEGINKRG